MCRSRRRYGLGSRSSRTAATSRSASPATLPRTQTSMCWLAASRMVSANSGTPPSANGPQPRRRQARRRRRLARRRGRQARPALIWSAAVGRARRRPAPRRSAPAGRARRRPAPRRSAPAGRARRRPAPRRSAPADRATRRPARKRSAPANMSDIAASTEGRLAAGDIELAYETFGDPGQPPVVLVMGLAMQMIAWPDEFCGALAERGHFVVRFDNRDVGASTHLDNVRPPHLADILMRRHPPYTISDMAADTVGLLDGLGLN